MSTTVTMNAAGLVQLPEAVRKLFRLEGPASLELEVQDDGIRLRPQPPVVRVAKLIRNQRGRLVIAGGPELDDHGIVQAIKAGRAEREDRIMGVRDGSS